MLDISSSCRTCMKENVTLVDLYENVKIEENSFQLAELLVQCTPTEVSKEDGLPQHLCDACVNVLQVAYTFRSQAVRAQDEYKKLLQSIKSEPSDVDLKTENDHDYYNALYEGFNFDHDDSKEELEEKDLTCTDCNKQFINKKKYLKHIEAHDGITLECTICKKTYHNQSSLNKHIAKHDEKNVCLISDQNFVSSTDLFEEIVDNDFIVKTENEVPEQILQCTDCMLTFTKQRSLSLHMRKHRNKDKKKEFICDACGKSFAMKHLLKRHLVMHSAVKPHKCTKCTKTFARRDQLMSHMYTHRKQKPYVCSYCNKSFGQTCSLKDHIRTHTGETPFLCSECGKGFTNNSNLRQHMMRHTGVKPYACNMCPKTFCTKGQMTSHLTTHTGEHPFKCEECGAAFTKQNSLKKHSLIHLAIRPFACETCNMRFTCKDHLKRHTRIHTGEKPYKCNFCERAFSQSNDLVKHTRQHIGQNIYQCTICGSRFRLLSELKQHYPIHFANGKTDANGPSTKEPQHHITKDPMFNSLPFKDKEHPLIKPPEVEVVKDKPMLALKPTTNGSENDSSRIDPSRIVVTIDRCDANGVVNGITIKLPQKDS